jgi:uncharacterized membrane protein/protein-disulfide isomerase
MTAKTRRLLLAFAVLGLGASSWSSYVHYSLLTVPGYTSFCDVSGAVSCTQAYLSQYGSLWGVPVALGGVIYFAAVLLMVGVAGQASAKGRENVPAYVFALSTVALAFVLYLGWASFFKLNTVCLLCATTYVAVIALFIISAGATTFPMTSLPRRASSDVARLVRSPLGLASVAGLALGTVALLNAFPREAHAAAAAGAGANGGTVATAATVAATSASSAAATPAAQVPALTDQQKADFLKWYEMQPRVSVPVDLEGAKVLVVKFNDFQCPPCRNSYLEYKPIIEKYRATGQLKYVLKHFPLERECNAAVQSDVHAAACEAAAALVMAQSKGTADKLEEWFFANQPSLSPDKVKEGAAAVAGITDFEAQYSRALTLVKTDAGLGALLGAKSTPTFVINGHVIAGALPAPYFEAAIQQEISR